MSDSKDLFDDPEIAELVKETAADVHDLTAPIAFAATPSSIDYALQLIEKSGYDENDYNFKTMSQKEVSDLIDELRSDLGYA